MENLTQITTPRGITEPKNQVVKSSKISIIIFILIGLAIITCTLIIGIQIGKNQTAKSALNTTVQKIPSVIPSNQAVMATATPIIPSSTPTEIPPTATPIPKTYAEEEQLLINTLVGFENYIGNSNTAGALSFFTKAQSEKAKIKYESIRTKNLPFTLKSYSSVRKGDDTLATEVIKNGYRVRVNECRSNTTNCPIFFVELVRNESAENGFSIDRYYDISYAYQNNLGEEIKYQGFGL